jgi:hypothetical protein
MASTITDLQSGSLEQRREGVNVLTKEQQFNTSILRFRSNSSDLLVYAGRVVNDNFFDENLLDENVSGSITSAPNHYAEKRTLGQSNGSDNVFTDIRDFDPVEYLEDQGLALYPIILTAAGFADPIVDDGSVGVFETRREVAGVNFIPAYAKRGAKASFTDSVESTGKKLYFLVQENPRDRSEYPKAEVYFEIGDYDTTLVEVSTYQDQESPDILPFIDSSDSAEASEWTNEDTMNLVSHVSDPEISAVLAGSRAGSYKSKRDTVSATAGWTFLNVLNGTDSIVYSDRM